MQQSLFTPTPAGKYFSYLLKKKSIFRIPNSFFFIINKKYTP